MADAIVGGVVERLTSMLVDRDFQEAARLIHFNQNLRGLVDELRPIRAVLSDAYQKSKRNPLIQDWLLDLQDVVYDAEDLFEDCQSLPLDTVSHPRPRCCCFSCVSPSHLLFRYRMGKRVDKLMNRIAKIRKRSQDFQLAVIAVIANFEPASNMSAGATLSRTVFLRDESETVGIGDSIAEITSWLSDEGPSHFQPRRRIAVVGMGGMGKTHLLTHVFKAERGKFEKSAWLTISQSYSPKALQERLGTEISLPVEGVSTEEARDSIFECLRGKRTLLILDDVWSGGRQLLDDLGVPNEDCCKVIVSTRSRDVAEKMSAQIYEMPRLSKENSWSLFCRYAFPPNGVPPEELKDVAGEIEGKCKRLPLAIKTVAASMASRRRPTEWKDALKGLTEVDLSSDVMPVLEMSYEALPSHLKLCFLFCSAFPEDYVIDCNFLKALWIGEGIVYGGERTEPSDVAQGCLNALINLCLIEAYPETDGRVEVCKMHDLLRELALGKSQNEMRCFFQPGKKICELPVQQLSGRRRASLMACDLQITLQNSAGLESLRTLLLSNNRDLSHIDADFLRNLKHLRVLDLSRTGISVLPQSLESLKHLRVLNLSSSKMEELPETVNHLRHLQYLDVSLCSSLKKLPLEIGQLKCLTYLDLLNCLSIEFMPKAVSLLTSLETLTLPDV